MLMLLVMGTAAQAQWVWRDANGRMTASDLPPPREIPDRSILQRPEAPRIGATGAPTTTAAPASPAILGPPALPATAASAPAAPSPLEAELQTRRKAAEQEQAAKAKTEADKQAAVRTENCGRARNQVAALDSGQRIARFNDKGEREVLDDRGRTEEMRRARQVIASDCR